MSIGTTGARVAHESLNQVHAASIPDAIIEVSEGGRFDFVAAFNPNCLTKKTCAGYCVHLPTPQNV